MSKEYNKFEKELRALISKHNIGNKIGVTDSVLAEQMVGIIYCFKSHKKMLDNIWFGDKSTNTKEKKNILKML